MRLTLLGVLALAPITWTCPSAAQDLDPIALLQKGIFAIKRADFGNARVNFESVIDLDARNFTALYYVAVCDAHDGDNPAALCGLRRSVEAGFPRWRALAEDPYFARARDDEAFKKGLAALLEHHEQRAKGILSGLTFDFQLRTFDDQEIAASRYRGKVLAVVFLDPGQTSSLEAASYIADIIEGKDRDIHAVGLARVSGKDRDDRNKVLKEYAQRNVLPFPLARASDAVRAQLKPFRVHPTILFLDEKGVPRRIVEGLPKTSPAKVYREAIDVITKRAGTEGRPGTENGGKSRDPVPSF